MDNSTYQNDTIENVYDEIKALENDIIASGANIRRSGDREATAAANYEGRKTRC